MDKLLLSVNEAIAHGAFDGGVCVGCGYPGTPSTEILENLSTYPSVYTEWSVNEKVAYEVAIGASLSGARSIVTMKHVGLNVAADPLFTSSYVGVVGGFVIICADDPDMHSSQNEQDNRHYAYAAKIPMLEPSDSQEAYDFMKLAFELSEKYDTPVMVRITTRIAHSKTVVVSSEKRAIADPKTPNRFVRNIKKYVMIPGHARLRHREVEKRLLKIKEDSNTLSINKIESNDKELGIITSGVCYNYAKEAFPDASFLKLGMTNPLPDKIIRDFTSNFSNLFVIEELDPYLELFIKAMGINVKGKDHLPITGEFNPDIIREAISNKTNDKTNNKINEKKNFTIDIPTPPRPPSLCAGCPHRKLFTVLNKLKLTATGDIGCYTLGVLPPFSAMDTCIDMGASITVAQGIEIGEGDAYKNDVVAVLGDSTFAHSGITGLLNAAYNKRNSLIIVLDNGTTAMTGMQPNPLSGELITGEPTVILDYKKLASAVGISDASVKICDAYKEDEIEDAICSLKKSKRLSLLVIKGMCVILKRKKMKKKKAGDVQ